MGVLRAAAAAILVVVSAAAHAQCVSSVRVLPNDSGAASLVAGPLAWNGSTIAVAKTTRPDRSLWVALYDQQLQTVVSDRKINGPILGEPLAVLWNGADYGVFYRTTSSTLELRRLSADGNVSSAIRVTTRSLNAPDEIDIKWSDALDAYVIARTVTQGHDLGTWVTLVERDGTVRSDIPLYILPARPSYMRVAVTDSGVIGAFFEASTGKVIYGRVTNGVVSVFEVGDDATDLVVTAYGEGFVLAHRVISTSGSVIEWSFVDLAGDAFEGGVLVTGSGIDVRPTSLVAAGDELGLAYIDAPFGLGDDRSYYRLRRFTADGVTVSDTFFSVANLQQIRARSSSPIVWTGDAYLSTAVRQSTLDSLLIRLCPLRTMPHAAAQYVRADDVVTFSATTEGGLPGYTYRWDFGDNTPVSTRSAPTHEFFRPGTYTVTVTTTDASGATVVNTITMYVVVGKHRAVRH